MSEPTVNALTQRLDRLEQNNRRWKRISVALPLALVAAVLLMGQAIPTNRTVDAAAFRIRDAGGTVRVSLGPQPDGSVAIVFFDTDGTKPRVMLGLNQGQPTLAFSDQSLLTRVVLAALDDGTLNFAFRGAGRTLLRAGINIDPSGASALVLFDKDGKLRANLAIEDDGRPGLQLLDKNGRIIWNTP